MVAGLVGKTCYVVMGSSIGMECNDPNSVERAQSWNPSLLQARGASKQGSKLQQVPAQNDEYKEYGGKMCTNAECA